MRRIVIVVILVAAFAVAGYMLFRPKGGAQAAKAKTTVADSSGKADATFGQTAAVKPAAKRTTGKTTGSLKPMTREERKAQVKKLRAEEKRRKKELKRQEREKRKMLQVRPFPPRQATHIPSQGRHLYGQGHRVGWERALRARGQPPGCCR